MKFQNEYLDYLLPVKVAHLNINIFHSKRPLFIDIKNQAYQQ